MNAVTASPPATGGARPAGRTSGPGTPSPTTGPAGSSARTAPTVGPLRLSWSRLRLHDECPAKGQLIAERKKSPVANIRHFIHGNVTDLLQRRYLSLDGLSAASPELGWMAAQVDAVFDEAVEKARTSGDGVVRWRGPDDRAQTLEFCRELVIRLEPLLVKYVLPYDWTPAYRFEVPVRIPYGTCVRQIALVGEIDLLVFGPRGGIAVWDLKATRDGQYYRKVLGQLSFYNIAVKASKSPRLGQWPAMSGLIQPMCAQRMLPVTVDGQAIREMSARIERTARDIWDGNLPARPNDWCGSCEVRHACPRFGAAGNHAALAV